MAHLIWTEPALADLEKIAAYIALENPDAARSLVRKVCSVVERLERHPASGKVPAELDHSRHRAVVCGPLRFFYRHTADDVFILHVMRSERGLRDLLLEGCINAGR